MSSHRYSQHASLYKRKRGKDPSFFYSSTTGHWLQNKATNKNECQKGAEKTGEMLRNRGEMAIDT